MAFPSPPSHKVDGLPSLTFQSYGDGSQLTPWDSIITQGLAGIWLFYAPKREATQSARGWVLGLATRKGRIVALYPQQHQDSGEMAITCRPVSSEEDAPDGKDLCRMVTHSTMQFGRAVVPGTTLGHLLASLEKSGIGHYGLKDGRGLRFWLALAICQMQAYVKEPRDWDTLPEIAAYKLRFCEGVPSAKGEEGAPIVMGKGQPHRWSSQGWDTFKRCERQVFQVTNRIHAFGAM